MSATTISDRKYREALGRALPVVIENEAEYERLLGELKRLMDKEDAEIAPEEGRVLKLLAMLVEEYEDRNLPLPKGTPQKMVKYLLEEKGLEPRDLWEVLGSKSRVSEILSGKRSISKTQAKKLAGFFRAPVELFL
jgi:HTH-type transcriptional regulator/antitoxin HigA